MPNPTLKGLLVRIDTAAGERPATAALGAAAASLRSIGLGELEPLFDATTEPPAGLAAAARHVRWYRAGLASDADKRTPTPWDVAHEAARSGMGLTLGAAGAVFIEPDLEQAFLTTGGPSDRERLAARGHAGVSDPPDPALPSRAPFAWFLDDDFSGLKRARERVGDPGEGKRVRIAHLDTGYDATHVTRPEHLMVDLQRNFVEGDRPRDARDPGIDHPLAFDQPGHGTGTLGILAGNKVSAPIGGRIDDFLGGAPHAEIVPLRIASSVVLLRTSALAAGLNHVSKGGPRGGRLADVVSLSMGGLASAAWADAVNKAYEAGVCIVAAAGNNFSVGRTGVPTRFIVYPARFRRVIAACGVMADRKPYFGLPIGTMQGNWGPDSKMATALAAFTPNVPWAELGAPTIIDLDGAGTSAATPQIAAAAALWLTQHQAALSNLPEPWQRVEAVRHALFASAEKTADGGRSDKLGNGILRATAALDVAPISGLIQTPRDSAAFAFLLGVTGLGVAAPSPATEMFALEATQLAQREVRPGEANPFEDLLPDPDLPASAIPRDRLWRFVEALAAHPQASQALRAHLNEALRSVGRGPSATRAKTAKRRRPEPDSKKAAASTPASSAAPTPAPARAAEPMHRRLRGFAIDPSLANQLSTLPISAVTYAVPWEPLAPGPVGEYVEVVDIDPASGCFYEPVDLDDPRLLAQDGLAPSEGSPQFHQQMVYAVTSLTIRNFERALGRKVLWAPGPPPPGADDKNDAHYVPRLRIHPHALREANAYYSRSKVALLFGYFAASDDDPGDHPPGGMVFTCLSHDIVAHETTHALLDGMHRRFMRPTNPDVLAFHEAFADLVALFQHFTMPDVLRDQVARTKGDIRSQRNVLGELAGEFGRTTGMGGALRSAIGERVRGESEETWQPLKPDPRTYETTLEPHARGAILVAAVFDAFLSIYEARVTDLLRLATGGSGVLAAGAIPPDLVNRLSETAAKVAQQVLTMCIRALDYCPPVDLTFGEYLRALITADVDLVRDDDLGYRVAFIEAFRRRGIYPRDVRTLSVDSLRWHAPEEDEYQASAQLLGGLETLRDSLPLEVQAGSREQIFHASRDTRRAMHGWLVDHFADRVADRAVRGQDAAFLGIDPDSKQGFEVHSVRLADRVGPDGELLRQIVIEILQEIDVAVDAGDPRGPKMTMEGGCTIVADLHRRAIRFCIRKRAQSEGRLSRQREFVSALARSSLYTTYFGAAAAEREPIARLHSGIL